MYIVKGGLFVSPYLFYTTTPVLLGGSAHAGRRAKAIWEAYHLTPHWFGRGRHWSLTAYAQKHTLPQKISLVSDTLLVQILIDFAKEQQDGNILVLIPCSKDAQEFLTRQKAVLETYFVILPHDTPLDDPLSLLIKNQRNELI